MEKTSKSVRKRSRWLPRMSLGQQIIAAAVGVLGSFGGVALYQYSKVASQLTESHSQSVQSYAQTLSESVAAQFFERYGDVQAFAENTIFASSDVKSMQMVLNQYAKLYGIYELIVFVDAEGHFIASNSLTPSGQNVDLMLVEKHRYSEEPWFQNVKAGSSTDDKEKGFSGTVYIDYHRDDLLSALAHGHRFATHFASPVKQGGRILGYLCNRASFTWVENEFQQLQERLSHQGMGGVRLSLLNAKNDLIVHSWSKDGAKAQLNRDVAALLHPYPLSSEVAKKVNIEKVRRTYFDTVDSTSKERLTAGFTVVDSAKFPEQIGWKVLVDIPTHQIMGSAEKAGREFNLAISFLTIASLIVSFFVARWISAQFSALTQRLEKAMGSLEQVGGEIQEKAAMSEEATEKSGMAVQRSVAALSEMGSMINQTNINVRDALATSNEAENQSRTGREILAQLSQTVQDVKSASAELQKVTLAIQDIDRKTAVINEIVFKTQRLSFNASIEAARAGDHGRGFAVVAEEVGELAVLSGKSAQEIHSIIESSREQVEQTLTLLSERIQESDHVGQRAVGSFEAISKQIDRLNGEISAIAKAAQEQEIGIRQANQAMTEISQASQISRETAKITSRSAAALHEQSLQVESVIQRLSLLVEGKEVQGGEGRTTKPTASAVLSAQPVVLDGNEKSAA